MNAPKYFLLERRQARDRRRRSPAHAETADEIDEQSVNDVQHEAGKTAAAIVSLQTSVIVGDQGDADLLIGVAPRLIMRSPR